MNHIQLSLTLALGPTASPACEGHETAELESRIDAIRAAVAQIPGASILDVDLEIIGTQAVAG